jgi:hypothetical protein
MNPDTPILLSSGFGGVEASRRFGNSGVAGFLQKPYTVNTLARQCGNRPRRQGRETGRLKIASSTPSSRFGNRRLLVFTRVSKICKLPNRILLVIVDAKERLADAKPLLDAAIEACDKAAGPTNSSGKIIVA